MTITYYTFILLEKPQASVPNYTCFVQLADKPQALLSHYHYE